MKAEKDEEGEAVKARAFELESCICKCCWAPWEIDEEGVSGAGTFITDMDIVRAARPATE